MNQGDSGTIVPVGGAPYDRWRYSGPAGVVEFEVVTATHAGRALVRGGKQVSAISIASLRWLGTREGQPIDEAERAALVAELRRIYRAEGRPFDLVFPTGEIEDETGSVRPGFRSALPRAEHSDGWVVADFFLSPEFPDAADAPPTVEYADPAGTAHIPRQIEVAKGTRRSVLDGERMQWVGKRAGETVSPEDRRRVLERVRIVYEHWNIAYRLR